MDRKEQLSPILKATNELLKHFSHVHADAMSRLRDVKTELFELTVRLDELNRTKNLYTMNTNRRKNVFSPIQEDESTQKESELAENIRNLTERKQALEARQTEEQICIHEAEEQLHMLRRAQLAAIQIGKDPAFSGDPDDTEVFEYVEDPAPSASIRPHGEQILLLNAFDKAYHATILEKRVLDPLSGQTNRIRNLRKILAADPEQAKLMLDELESQNESISRVLKSEMTHFHMNFDEKRPINTVLDEWIMNFRDKHPEYVMDSSIQVKDETLVLPYICTTSLIRLLDMFFDNIVRHADANQIRFRAQISGSIIDIFLSDNGIGLPEKAYENAPWYSSLHKAEEILFLLDGRMQLTGSKDHGTTVRFTLPL